MSQSLAKNDWEITPVQAWFLLIERYDVKAVLGHGAGVARLDTLKSALGALVECFAFGAVMEVRRFWDAVEVVMRS